ncbi:hypothetical protein HJC23_011953 [Cyclotella cryptica]|uniref:Uncharacterized protein n=1 Tax=Cyclotella cryptica TaxID=29204 RepID=A0ABD3QQC2_9STRA
MSDQSSVLSRLGMTLVKNCRRMSMRAMITTTNPDGLEMNDFAQGSKSRGFALIGQWLQHKFSPITQGTTRKRPKQVSFSEYSNRRCYKTDSSYEATKSYSSADWGVFRKQAIREGLRIEHLVSSCPVRNGPAMYFLLKNNLITCEDLLGIEGLVGRDRVAQVSRERRAHRDLILSTQNEMRKTNENTVNAEKLAGVSIMRSSRSVEKARLRAALAFDQSND